MAAKVLLLEDDPNFRISLADVLEDEDYTVYQVADSDHALSCARHTALDLVVSDVRMAGLDGLETLQLLHESQPQLRSIVMTGYADDSAPMRAVKARASDYLYKPFSREDFLCVVRRVLEGEKESSRYQGLLERVLKGYRGLVTSAQLMTFEKDRERVFQAYFVLIRSKRLSAHEALLLWERMRTLESDREAFKTGKDSSLRAGLVEGYQKLADTLSALTQSLHVALTGSRPSTPEERLRFSTLYERIQQGTVSMEQLKLAPLLDSMSALAVRDLPELAALHAEIWGRSSLDSR